jgi:hypothetical protein
MKVKATFYKEEGLNLVKITFKKDYRIFRVFSGRAGKTLALMAESFPDGITTKEMRELHGIDDNKLFGELLDQSGFREYMEHQGTRGRLKVWKLHLILLWENTTKSNQPIWFGMHTQNNLQKHFSKLEKKYGLVCNILGIELLKETKSKFLSNFRKIAIDHRVPQLKKGSDDIDNLQILSYYVNERKNQICAKCVHAVCSQCALAFPEKTSIIFPSKEDISSLLSWRNEN